ncbi:MAG TPA: hypothetical protein VLH15_08640, partial [Dehalococcoidales bacterium]|nr:hypothetical protein [Dehalococcoidales bacterium]
KSMKKTPEEFRQDLKPVAVKTLKQSLVLSELARVEEIKIEQADLKAEIEGMVKDVEGERKQKLFEILSHPQNQVNIASQLATRKTVARLVELISSSEKIEQKTEDSEPK